MEEESVLGPFRVHEVIGKGGTSFVFRGEHVGPLGQSTNVAIKLMRPDYLTSAGARDSFLREVRSVAQLNHPCIVRLYDVDEVRPQDRPPPGPMFEVGRLYLAMEYVRGRSLAAAAEGLDFSSLRSMLLDLLDALAHAHAAGVIHRDLKPSNILVEEAEGMRLRLTDFGVARSREPEVDEVGQIRGVSGTPKYMAPEQVLGLWRDEGPWTDLYALGVVCWSLASGVVPFAGDTREVMRAHVYGELPRFAPVLAVPDGFEDWVRTLLAKSPADRFRRAADAAFALMSLDGPLTNKAETTRELVGWGEDLPTLVALDEVTHDSSANVEESLRVDRRFVRQPDRQVANKDWPSPPIPMAWQRLAEPKSPHLWGAGLGLYGLRRIPVVGRSRERTLLWSELRAAKGSGRARSISFRGDRGIGKSRLLDWLAVRSHELGAATVLRVSHSERAGPAHGLGAMLERSWSLIGLDREQVTRRVTEVTRGMEGLVPGDRELLVDLMRPPDTERAHRTQREVFASLGRLFQALGRNRPVLMLADDAQWGPETVAFAEFLSGAPFAALCVLAFEQDAGEVLGSSIELEPLAVDELQTLTEGLLGVAPDVARSIAEHAAGSPLYAVELVGGWVHSSKLVAGPGGFVLDDRDQSLPMGLDQLWRDRVDRVCAGYSEGREDVRLAVDVAAVLGRDVDRGEWRMTVAAVGARVPDDLVDRLVNAGLAVDTPRGWSFSHGRVAAAIVVDLEHRASAFFSIQRAVARTLEFLYGRSTEPSHAVRRATHSAAANDVLAASRAFRRATSLYFHRGDPDGLEGVIELWANALDRAEVPAEHPARWRRQVWQGRLAMYRGEFDTANEWLRDAYERARSSEDMAVHALTARLLGTLSSNRDPRGAEALYREALACYRAVGDDAGEAICLCNLAHVLIVIGDPEEVVSILNDASTVAKRRNDPALTVEVAYQRGAVCRTMGRLELAAEHLARAMEIADSANWRSRLADIEGDYADVLRMQGDLAGAEERMRAVLATRAAIGEEELGMTSLNLALVQVQRGDHATALPRIKRLLATFEERGAALFEQFALATLICANAGLGDWEAVRSVRSRYDELAASMEIVDPDLAYVLAASMDAANRAGEEELGAWLQKHVSFQREQLSVDS